MGYYLQIDTDAPVILASLSGWGDVLRWANHLPPKGAGAIHHLCEHGWEDDFVGLKTQLATNLKSGPPKDAPTKQTLDGLIAALNAHKGAATVVSVTDGLGEDDGEPDAPPAAQSRPPAGRTEKPRMNLAALIPAGPYAIEPRHGYAAYHRLSAIDLHLHMEQYNAAKASEGDYAGAAADKSKKPYPMNGGVALLALTGPMTKDGGPSLSSGTSTARLRRTVRQASADPDVTAILLRIDSPGGEVAGTGDLARDVAAAAQKKPCYAYIEDLGASAAYWVASQCNQIYANPSALVGSIGTYMVIPDASQMAESEGIKVHVVRAGDHKGAGVPGAPVTEQHLAHFQGIVDTLNSQFLSAVNRGRSLSLSQNVAPADGSVLVGAAARAAGLIDGITSYDNVLAKLKSYKPTSG